MQIQTITSLDECSIEAAEHIAPHITRCEAAFLNALQELGEATKRSFSVRVGKNVYRCFSCASRGNVLDFWSSYRQQTLWESARELNGYLESSNPTWVVNAPPKPKPTPNHPAKMARS